MLLPVFQGIADPGRLRRLGLMDCRHPWRAGDTVTWAVLETPSMRFGREEIFPGAEMAHSDNPEYRRLTFRMTEIVADPGVVSMTRERWAALGLEEGRLADLALIDQFHELDEPGRTFPPSLAYVLDRMGGRFSPFRMDMAAGFHAAEEPIRPIEATTAAEHGGVLTLDMLRQARDLLSQPQIRISDALRDLMQGVVFTPRGSGHTWLDTLPEPRPPTVEDIVDATADQAAMGELNTRVEGVGLAEGGGYRSTPDCDVESPPHAEPLAPLPDWLAKVDNLIEEVKR